MSGSETKAEILAVILDARVALLRETAPKGKQAEAASPALVLPALWDALFVFCQAHASLTRDQEFLLFAANSRRATLLAGGQCQDVDWTAVRGPAGELLVEDGGLETPQVAIALSKALCSISRVRHDAGWDMPARILLISASSTATDLAAQGTALTSGAFAAQNAGVPVDCLSLGQAASSLLRQVSILTSGKHRVLGPGPHGEQGQHSTSEVLVPTLLFHFAAGVKVRKELHLIEDMQNLAAVCVCHGEAREIAHVCSCCLAVYCSGARGICTICRTRFRQDHETDPRLMDLDLSTTPR